MTQEKRSLPTTASLDAEDARRISDAMNEYKRLSAAAEDLFAYSRHIVEIAHYFQHQAEAAHRRVQEAVHAPWQGER